MKPGRRFLTLQSSRYRQLSRSIRLDGLPPALITSNGFRALSTTTPPRPPPPADPTRYPPDPQTSPPGLSPHPRPSKPPSRLQRYAPRLAELSRRTGTPLPSLGISFLILHELTAIVPLVLLYFIFQALGTGAGLVVWLSDYADPSRDTARSTESQPGGVAGQGENSGLMDWRGIVRGWLEEGQKRVERVGKRYGILGYEKVDRKAVVQTEVPAVDTGLVITTGPGRSTVVAGGVADAIAAYVVVKALLPARIAVSLGAAPAFARFALNPIQRLIGRLKR